MDTVVIAQFTILNLSKVKPNFSELARMYGCDRRTIKKYYDGYEGKPNHHNKPSKLDCYEELIKQKLSIKGTTIKTVMFLLLVFVMTLILVTNDEGVSREKMVYGYILDALETRYYKN